MEKLTSEDLNTAAMQIIILAGEGRDLITEALKETFADSEKKNADEKLKSANEKITAAHRIQTDTIQYTIEDDELQTTLLFSHAQDSLMSVYSEWRMAGYMIEMYYNLRGLMK